MTRFAAIAVAIVAAGAVAFLVFGGDDDEPKGKVLGELRAGSAAELTTCADWNEGSTADKFATVENIRRSLVPRGQEEFEDAISDEDAFDVFEAACSRDFARSFRLYKLYTKANAFGSIAP